MGGWARNNDSEFWTIPKRRAKRGKAAVALSGTKRERDVIAETVLEEDFSQETVGPAADDWMVSRLRILWERRRFVMKALMFGSSLAPLIAFSLPKRFESTPPLIPPDTQSITDA